MGGCSGPVDAACLYFREKKSVDTLGDVINRSSPKVEVKMLLRQLRKFIAEGSDEDAR